MSRTYRRKNEIQDYYWILRNLDIDWRFRHKLANHDPKSKEGKKKIRIYHSDGQITMEQVPKWYKIYFCRRPFKRKEKKAIMRALKYPEEDVVFPKPVKDALYYW